MDLVHAVQEEAKQLAGDTFFRTHADRLAVATDFIGLLANLAGASPDLAATIPAPNFATALTSGLQLVCYVLDAARASLAVGPLLQTMKTKTEMWIHNLERTCAYEVSGHQRSRYGAHLRFTNPTGFEDLPTHRRLSETLLKRVLAMIGEVTRQGTIASTTQGKVQRVLAGRSVEKVLQGVLRDMEALQHDMVFELSVQGMRSRVTPVSITLTGSLVCTYPRFVAAGTNRRPAEHRRATRRPLSPCTDLQRRLPDHTV